MTRSPMAYADSLGYGFCGKCYLTLVDEDRPFNRYTADAGETCECCGHDMKDGELSSDRPQSPIVETTTVRIF